MPTQNTSHRRLVRGPPPRRRPGARPAADARPRPARPNPASRVVAAPEADYLAADSAAAAGHGDLRRRRIVSSDTALPGIIVGTTGTPNVGGMYLVLLILGAGMLIQLFSLISSLLAFVMLVGREPDLLAGRAYALVACGSAVLAVLATVLMLWWAGAVKLLTFVPLYSPSIVAALVVLGLWKVRSLRAKRRAG